MEMPPDAAAVCSLAVFMNSIIFLTCFEISPLDIFRLLFLSLFLFFPPSSSFTSLVPEGRRFKKLSRADFPCFYISHSKQRRPAVRSLWRYLKRRCSQTPVCIDKEPVNINPSLKKAKGMVRRPQLSVSMGHVLHPQAFYESQLNL